MGGELGGPWGFAPRFRPRRTRGGPEGFPPGLGHGVQGESGGLAPLFRPQHLELTHFVTGSVMFFVVFHAFFATYIPHPKPSFSQQVPLACWWFSGIFPHILILEH